MSDITSVPVGSLPRASFLPTIRGLISGAIKDDPTVLFSQLKDITPLGIFSPGAAISGAYSLDRPARLCTILVASTLTVPLTKQGAPYFDCGKQWAGPEGDSIPAADADSVSYGIYAFGDAGGTTFYGTEGAFRFATQGTLLPEGLTVGWRVSLGAWSAPTFACATSLHNVPHLSSWCAANVDNSGKHRGGDTLGTVQVSWSVVTTKTSDGYTFMTLLAEETG